MVKQADVSKVRREIISHVGSRVKIKANRGRNKMDITEGIITQTYPSIFLIQIDDAGSDAVKTMSFSYADVLTKDVQMMLC
ncbi:Veg family protein [Anaerocolumna sp. MB42-C2]|uniref:Veg family protein n=1 Tax=Anaerocolumna sp. MB42-C2 TaxID=3070997 RepID=UPI0027E116E3|nr:Veg family protein [Anaerocolumna sp. MB42-C2]WMJ85288.1 Veg family protein [Anaerocolumna sp. MB42-C2]